MFDFDDFDFQEFMEEEREICQCGEERRRNQNKEWLISQGGDRRTGVEKKI